MLSGQPGEDIKNYSQRNSNKRFLVGAFSSNSQTQSRCTLVSFMSRSHPAAWFMQGAKSVGPLSRTLSNVLLYASSTPSMLLQYGFDGWSFWKVKCGEWSVKTPRDRRMESKEYVPFMWISISGRIKWMKTLLISSYQREAMGDGAIWRQSCTESPGWKQAITRKVQKLDNVYCWQHMHGRTHG